MIRSGPQVEARALEVQDGDRLLLCSDGLTEMVTNEAIAATLDAEPGPEAAAKKLLAQANDGAANDNITLLVVRFDPADSNRATSRPPARRRIRGRRSDPWRSRSSGPDILTLGQFFVEEF